VQGEGCTQMCVDRQIDPETMNAEVGLGWTLVQINSQR